MFTKPLIRQIGSEIEAAVQEIAKKHNIGIAYGGAKLSDINCTLRLKMRAKGEAADKANGSYAELLGLPKDIVGKTFKYRTSTYTIKGLDIQKIKYPVIVKNHYKFTVDSVKRALNL